MHYHFGLFAEVDRAVDDAAMDAALDEAVRVLYPHIPDGATVLDVGCGWGGTLRMLTSEKGCTATGITNSRAQQAWCRDQGLTALLADAEQPDGIPDGPFDVAILLESLSHIRDKGALLERLAAVARRLVLRANCNQQPEGATFGGSMTLLPADSLVALAEASGWRVRSTVDRRAASMPTFDGWSMRLARLEPALMTDQLGLLGRFCVHAKRWGAAWAVSNPLIDLVAESRQPAATNSGVPTPRDGT